MPIKKLKIGVIGCGRAAVRLHLPALATVPDAEVVAVADLDAAKVDEAAQRFGIKRTFSDPADLLAQADVDVAAILVPAQFHVGVALQALDAGKHIFIEKPIALALDDARMLVERAAESPQSAMMGLNFRCHRLIQKAKRMIQAGKLGRLVSINSVWTTEIRALQQLPAWRDDRKKGGGVVFEVSTHHLDLYRFLTGSEISDVFALSQIDGAIDTTVSYSLRMADGVLVSSMFSEKTGGKNQITICGDKAWLTLTLSQFDGFDFHPLSLPSGSIAERFQRLRCTLAQVPDLPQLLRYGGDYRSTFRAEWVAFLASIRDGAPAPVALIEGLRALEAAHAIIESVDSQQKVVLTESARVLG